MTNPTTVRLTPEQEEQVKKMAYLFNTSQSAVFIRAVGCLWELWGARAEEFAAAAAKLREEHDR